MAHRALSHQSWLTTFLTLPGGPPCHDTFNRVFSALDPRQLEDALRKITLNTLKIHVPFPCQETVDCGSLLPLSAGQPAGRPE